MRMPSFSSHAPRYVPVAVAIALLCGAAPVSAQSIFVGPTPYASSGDVPALFYVGGAATALENFEDCSLDAGGITGTSSQVVTKDPRPGCIATFANNVDSVDADDGSIDGSGVDGASYFGSNFFEFVFPAPVTAAGLVYTDGPGPVYFEAFGPGHVSLGQTGPFMLDDGLNGTVADDRFLGVKNLGGIESIEIFLPTGAGVEVDHVQYGDAATLVASWDDGQAIQGSGGGLDPALWVGLELAGASPPAVTTPDGETVVLSYGGLDPNEQLQIDVASYGLPFYPPDPIKVVGNQIQVVFIDGGTMATLTIDVASSSGGIVDPSSVVGFNPQPEPPSPDLFAFNPPPGGDSESLAIQAPLVGGSGPPGGTQISLTLRVLDNAMTPLPTSPVSAVSVPAMGPLALAVLGLGLAGGGVRALRRRRAS